MYCIFKPHDDLPNSDYVQQKLIGLKPLFAAHMSGLMLA